MLARRDTRTEATRLRRLAPLQAVEDQSRAWGLCCHSCTWREGFAPSWRTELRGSSSPRGLPGSQSFLSTNGSHFNEDRCRIRKDHAAENMVALRHIALNLLRQEHSHRLSTA